MRIYVLDPIHEECLTYAKKNGDIIKWDDDRIDNLSEADAIIVRTQSITKEMMLEAPNLKIIAKHGIGTDNIDLKAANELGIIVTNTPQANMDSVAELAVSLIMSCARNIPIANNMVKEGIGKLAPEELTGFELSGKTIGLIGLGRIGYSVGTILKKGFNMDILGYDPYLSKERALELGVRKYDDLKEMLSISDVISISVPLTPSTINLISSEEFDVMKPSSIIVNTSRGKIINEDALYYALKDGKIKAAALDVFETEPPRKDNPLFTLKNFIGTPHIGAATEEALIRMGQTAIEEILRFEDGQEPLFKVTLESK